MLLQNDVPSLLRAPARNPDPRRADLRAPDFLDAEPGAMTGFAGNEAPPARLEAGVSSAWRRLLAQARMAAPSLRFASIEGEPGSGKQTLARYLWSVSPYAGTPFERHDAREWLLLANPSSVTGFIYLDRVDLLATPGQGLLLGTLKTLQNRNGPRTAILASSEAPLRQLAGQGRLLPDLAFRFAAVRFAIPPLRARKEDLVPLSQHLLQRICARYQHKPITLTPAALGRLLRHEWPGNVRELASVLEAALLESTDDIIRPGDLCLDAGVGPASAAAALFPPVESLALDAVIHRHVQHVLELNRGNKLRSARQLGISRSTLYRILASKSVLPGALRG